MRISIATWNMVFLIPRYGRPGCLATGRLWLREASLQGDAAGDRKPTRQVLLGTRRPADAELEALEKENKGLKEENAILKKLWPSSAET